MWSLLDIFTPKYPSCISDLTFLFFQGITEMFRAEDSDLDGVITISYEKFLTILLNSSLL